jgi:heterodisulfide reductase subunit A-like polyferredoxin
MKKAVLLCACSFACPSMKEINFAELAERIRLELPQDFMLLHPRLCEGNGEELLADLIKKDGVVYLTAACKPEKQYKLFRDGFQKAGVEMTDQNFKPVWIQFKNTDQAFEEIKKALEELEK